MSGKDDESDVSMLSSFELIEAARNGGASEMDRLFGVYRPHLLRWAHGRLPRGARALIDTEDVVQDVLFGCVRRVKSFDYRHSGAFQAYLHEGVRNRVRDEIRKLARGPLAKTYEERAAPHPSPLEELMGRETLSRYERALSRLKQPEREAIVARIELGLSYADVAQALGRSSPDAARMAVTRALVKLIEGMKRVR